MHTEEILENIKVRFMVFIKILSGMPISLCAMHSDIELSIKTTIISAYYVAKNAVNKSRNKT